MNNEAYKWLSEWMENGDLWYAGSYARVWQLALSNARSHPSGLVGFREDMRQLLADAETGRKLREWLLKDAEIRRNMRDNN